MNYAHPRILMYHMVREPIPGARFNKMRVPPSTFEAQLAYLQENHWQFATMKDWAEGSLNDRSVILTFDDGFADNYEQALPLLEKYNACATLYLVVYRHENDWAVRKKCYHNNRELVKESKLSDDQVREMLSSGRIELGSHTLTHPDLRRLSPEEKQEELHQSKTLLEETFGQAITSIAYPFGLFDERDQDLAQSLGYRTAVTTSQGIDPLISCPFALRRIKVSGKEGMHAFKLRLRTGVRGWHS